MVLKRHARQQAHDKRFPLKTIRDTFNTPERVYVSKSYPGQYRVTGNGIVLVGVPDLETGSFIVITVYYDQVLTPPRPDQLNTPQGKIFAERYAAGLGRSSRG